MATRTNTVLSNDILAALGGTVEASDDVRYSREGPAAYDTNLDALAAITLASFYALAPNASSFGAEGTALQVDAADVRFEGAHEFLHLAGVATKTITTLLIAGTGRARNFLSSMTATRMLLGRGTHRLAGSAIGTTADVYAGARVVAEHGATGFTTARVHRGGRLELWRGAGSLVVTGGRASVERAGLTITAAELAGGGVLDPSLGVPTTLTVRDGVIDQRRMAAPWPSGTTINIEGPLVVIPSPSGSVGDWYGAATVNNNAKIQVSVGPMPAGAGL
jgi:hypothetical protein